MKLYTSTENTLIKLTLYPENTLIKLYNEVKFPILSHEVIPCIYKEK